MFTSLTNFGLSFYVALLIKGLVPDLLLMMQKQTVYEKGELEAVQSPPVCVYPNYF